MIGTFQMNVRFLGLMTLVGALLLTSRTAVAEPGLLFDQSIYQAAPGETFEVQVLIDGDVATAAADAVANGLFSYGWQFEFDSAKASVDGLLVPAELNYFGFAAGASVTTGPGLAAAEGNIDQVAFTPYQDSLLATVTLKNLVRPDSYDLTLSLAPHFPTEQLFVDGQGNVLDDTIVLGTAKVLVAVPEPGTITLAGIGLCVAAPCALDSDGTPGDAVLILTLGMRGDLELFLILGLALAQRGHEVTVASSPFNAAAVECGFAIRGGGKCLSPGINWLRALRRLAVRPISSSAPEPSMRPGCVRNSGRRSRRSLR